MPEGHCVLTWAPRPGSDQGGRARSRRQASGGLEEEGRAGRQATLPPRSAADRRHRPLQAQLRPFTFPETSSVSGPCRPLARLLVGLPALAPGCGAHRREFRLRGGQHPRAPPCGRFRKCLPSRAEASGTGSLRACWRGEGVCSLLLLRGRSGPAASVAVPGVRVRQPRTSRRHTAACF